MCELIFMDVTLRAVVIVIFAIIFSYFFTNKKGNFAYFTKGLAISLIASILFLLEGFQLFNGYSDLERLPFCLLVIGTWGIGFYYYYKHFSSFFDFEYLNNFNIPVIVLMLLNVTVAFSGLVAIIPKTDALFATGLTTTLQGTFTFGLTFFITYKYYNENKISYKKTDLICTFCLALGNTSFLFLNNYSVALEIIIVAILIMSYNYIRNVETVSIKYVDQKTTV